MTWLNLLQLILLPWTFTEKRMLVRFLFSSDSLEPDAIVFTQTHRGSFSGEAKQEVGDVFFERGHVVLNPPLFPDRRPVSAGVSPIPRFPFPGLTQEHERLRQNLENSDDLFRFDLAGLALARPRVGFVEFCIFFGSGG